MERLWSRADLIEGGLRRPVYGRRVHAKEAPMGMLYAAIDIHKHVFQAATLDPESGELVQAPPPAPPVRPPSGGPWFARELQAAGVDVRLPEPVQARALKGRRRQAKTDKL